MRPGGAFAAQSVLITGGLGFIGSNLALRLVAEGASVTIVDALVPSHGGNRFNIDSIRDRVDVHIGDLRDRALLEDLLPGQDVLFNLAGQTSHLDSMVNPLTDLAFNATAQLDLLEACRAIRPDMRIVYASTRQIHGRPQYLPVDEDHPVDPVDINGIHKLAAEMYHSLYGRVYGLSTCILRLTNVYGPRMRVKDARQTFLGLWVRDLIQGEPLTVYGDGSQLRDLLYIDDCVEALLAAATDDRAVGRIYNLGSPEVVRLDDLAAQLAGLTPSGSFDLVPFPPERKVIDIGDYYGDYHRIADELGWEPKTRLRDGLARTVEFFREYGEHYW